MVVEETSGLIVPRCSDVSKIVHNFYKENK
jgi:hypothetical protein